jgi:hypothetical protein
VTRPSADATRKYIRFAALDLFCGLSFDGATTREIAAGSRFSSPIVG